MRLSQNSECRCLIKVEKGMEADSRLGPEGIRRGEGDAVEMCGFGSAEGGIWETSGNFCVENCRVFVA